MEGVSSCSYFKNVFLGFVSRCLLHVVWRNFGTQDVSLLKAELLFDLYFNPPGGFLKRSQCNFGRFCGRKIKGNGSHWATVLEFKASICDVLGCHWHVQVPRLPYSSSLV